MTEPKVDIPALAEMADERGEFTYDSNTSPLLDDAIAAGLVRPVNGRFGSVRETGETGSILGVEMPISTMHSIYELTPQGRTALAGLAQ